MTRPVPVACAPSQRSTSSPPSLARGRPLACLGEGQRHGEDGGPLLGLAAAVLGLAARVGSVRVSRGDLDGDRVVGGVLVVLGHSENKQDFLM